MPVAARAARVHVAVCNLIRSRGANIANGHGEIQGLTREFVICVDLYRLVANGSDSHNPRPLRGACMEAHSHFEGSPGWKHRALHLLHETGIQFTVGICRSHAHIQRFTATATVKRTLKTGDDVTMAMQVNQGLALRALIEHFAIAPREAVIHRYNAIFRDFHFVTQGKSP